MSKKYTAKQFKIDMSKERFTDRCAALDKVKKGKLQDPIEKVTNTIRYTALNDCSRKVREKAIVLCEEYNIKNFDQPITIPEEPASEPDNIDEIMLDVFAKCKVLPLSNVLTSKCTNEVRTKFAALYKTEFAIMNDVFPENNQFKEWVKYEYMLYKEAYRKGEIKTDDGLAFVRIPLKDATGENRGLDKVIEDATTAWNTLNN